ncbi:ABC transporter ATP-binding protein [Gorillibacterium timonense]|uniref:ABC transporter ATP-binding protein n=1 Tax=Gorillibacterium timonense TaxID=1689269 RepID=UPI00071C35F4|nr:ABC transporter ATP-binding protein [Gorillibacterium timonense]
MSKLSSFLKPYRKELVIGPIFKLIEAILELLLPTIVALIINRGVGQHDSSYILRMGGVMLVMTVCGYASSLVCQYYAARASQGYGTLLRNALFRKISSFSYAELDRFGTSTLTNRLTNDVNQLQFAVAMLIRLVIRAPFICIGAIIMAMILDFQLSLVLLAATPVFAVLLYWIISRTSPLYRSYQRKLDGLAVILSENLSGVRVIRAFAKSRREKERFREASDDLTATAIRVGRLSALLNPFTTLVVNAGIIAILWVGGGRIDSGRLSQGEIIAFINYVTQILLALIVVSNLVVIFTKAFSSAGRVSEVLAAEPSVKDAASLASHAESSASMPEPSGVDPEPRVLRVDSQWNGSTPTSSITKTQNAPAEGSSSSGSAPAIEFDRVSFGYSATGDYALTDVSVTIKRGETIGLIGGTGSGKTTFVNLIPRFYDAIEGSVKMDGIPVQEYPLLELRKKIGLVPQKAVLFTGTVADNIRWGKEDASDEEVLRAARIAQADEFIGRMPEGYATPISRGGLNLSGGQKQRLTIARAVVSRPDILILDDSSSALDFATDAALRRAIRESSEGTTVLLVSQRVSTIQHADKILVFEEGRLAGIGKHDELLRTCEVYREIAMSQLDAEEARR